MPLPEYSLERWLTTLILIDQFRSEEMEIGRMAQSARSSITVCGTAGKEGLSMHRQPLWDSFAARIQKHSGGQDLPSITQAHALADLLKIQREIGQFQLKVEFVSKLSESAVASIRKLQQNQ